MDQRELLTESQVAEILNCPISELPQRQRQGQIEAVQLRHDQRYRLIQPKQTLPKQPTSETETQKANKKTSPHPVNIDNLIKQYEDRGKILQLLEKNHALHLKKLFAKIKRLRQHRLVLIVTLEIFCGMAVIAATMAHDTIYDSRKQTADMYLVAQHHQQQYQALEQDNQEMNLQYRKITDRLKASQLEQARLETRLSIQEVNITEARKMISRLVEAVELSEQNVTSTMR